MRDRWYRSKWLHLVIGIIVAILAATFAGQRAHQGVLDNLDSRLRDAGAGADASLVVLEAEQLTALRSIEFTPGVAAALARTDAKALDQLVTPLQANSGIPMVDIVRPDGTVVLAVRSKGAAAGCEPCRDACAPPGDPPGERPARRALLGARHLRHRADDRDSRPAHGREHRRRRRARDDTARRRARRVSQQVRADLTAYAADGAPIATTSPKTPKVVPFATARALIGGSAVTLRYIHDNDREALGRLVIDHQPDAVLGVSLHDNSPVTGRAVTLLAALGLIATVFILATFWARYRLDKRKENEAA